MYHHGPRSRRRYLHSFRFSILRNCPILLLGNPRDFMGQYERQLGFVLEHVKRAHTHDDHAIGIRVDNKNIVFHEKETKLNLSRTLLWEFFLMRGDETVPELLKVSRGF